MVKLLLMTSFDQNWSLYYELFIGISGLLLLTKLWQKFSVLNRIGEKE